MKRYFKKNLRYEGNWKKLEAKAWRLEKKKKKEYGYVEGMVRRTPEHKMKSIRDPELVAPIRGVTICRRTQKRKLMDGTVKLNSYVYVTCAILSLKEGRRVRLSRYTCGYETFKQQWKEIVDFAIEHKGLSRAKTGWRKPPVTEEIFYKKLKEFEDVSTNL